MVRWTKNALLILCVPLAFLGIVYNVVVAPFSTPEFDLWAWSAIGIAFLILAWLGRKPK